MSNTRYRSKIDAWLVLLVIATGLLALTSGVPQILRGAPWAIPIAVTVFLLVVGLPAWLMATTAYWFEGQELCIRSGPVNLRIPVDQIRAVTPSRSVISSPALSLDRLRIDYGRHGSVLISPLDRKGFLAELETRRSQVLNRRATP